MQRICITPLSRAPPHSHRVMADPSLERMAALLSSYYGVQDETEESAMDTRDIDCSNFDMVRQPPRSEPQRLRHF